MAQKPSNSYKQMSEDLAEIMAWFESEQVDLDEAVAKYSQAMKLLGQMEAYLEIAQNKVRKVASKAG